MLKKLNMAHRRRQVVGFLGLVLGLFLTAPTRAEIVLIGTGTIPGDAVDQSGLKEKLGGGTPHHRLGAIGSAVAYTGVDNRYLVVSDQGPRDANSAYRCRMHFIDILVRPGTSAAVKTSLVSTVLLTSESGYPLVGASNAIRANTAIRAARFDPEGARISRRGTIFISDEYGPAVDEFDRKGKRLRSFRIPDKFLVELPDADPDKERSANLKGRVPNKGMEGLAIAPDGSKLYGLMQGPLIQDGGHDGKNVRLLEIDIGSNATREFSYPLENKHHGVHEILAVSSHQFLVLERDALAGEMAQFKKIFLIDLEGASDISSFPVLPIKGVPSTVAAVKKQVFLDLLDAKYGLAGAKFPAKLEGMAFGPDRPDGRHLLIVMSDNDFKKSEPTWIFAFAIDREDLPGFQKQVFDR